MTPDGRPYYQNMITIETSWEKPPGWVDSEDEAELEAVSAAGAAGTAMSGRGEPSGAVMDGAGTRDVPDEVVAGLAWEGGEVGRGSGARERGRDVYGVIV